MIRIKFRQLLANKEKEENTKYSYHKLEKQLGLSHNTISKWDRASQNGCGVKSIDSRVLETFCDFFGCQIGDLLELGE